MKKISNNMKKDVIIHVGLQKTGTTFLQEEIFRKMNVRYIRNINFVNLCFKRDKKTIIADEGLSGNARSNKVDRFKIADNLHKLFPDAKIIVGIRNPHDMIASLYSQYIRTGGYDEDGVIKSIISYTNYEEYIDYIQSLFKDVFIYNYDYDFKKEHKEAFIIRLCDFIGEPVPNYQDKRYRVRLKPYQLKTMRVINKLLKNHHFIGKVVRELINAVSNARMQVQ